MQHDTVTITEVVDPELVHITRPAPQANKLRVAVNPCRRLPTGAPKELRTLNHAIKMASKAYRREQMHAVLSKRPLPADVARAQGQRHEHKAEIVRRARQFSRKLWSTGTQPGIDGLSLVRTGA